MAPMAAYQSCQGTSWVAQYWPRSACSQQRQVQCSFTQRAASSKHQSMIPCWFHADSMLIPMFALGLIGFNDFSEAQLTNCEVSSDVAWLHWISLLSKGAANVCQCMQSVTAGVSFRLMCRLQSWRCFCNLIFFCPSRVKFGPSVSGLPSGKRTHTGSPVARIVWSTIKGKTIENSWSVVASLPLPQDPHAFSMLLNATNSISKRYAMQSAGTNCFKMLQIFGCSVRQ